MPLNFTVDAGWYGVSYAKWWTVVKHDRRRPGNVASLDAHAIVSDVVCGWVENQPSATSDLVAGLQCHLSDC